LVSMKYVLIMAMVVILINGDCVNFLEFNLLGM
jgi:hypothetical protein